MRVPRTLPAQELNFKATPPIVLQEAVAQVPKSAARLRLAQHMAVLQSQGHSDLSALGQLKIGKSGSAMTLRQNRGVVLPTTLAIDTARQPTGGLNGLAMARSGKTGFKLLSGPVIDIPVGSPSQLKSTNVLKSTIPLDVAYWFGTNITVASNTNIVLASHVKSLVIIGENLSIGSNVTITWERPQQIRGTVPPKPPAPGSRGTATSVGSERGWPGTDGKTGGQGEHGQPAPEVELWFLTSTGFPAVDLRGQDGDRGIDGGPGGDGGQGQKGCSTAKNLGFCSQEQGPGGDGGNGGRGGNGGNGGIGGTGGRFAVFAPQAQINTWLGTGLTISVDGGQGGTGGEAGRPGEGGPGGAKGDHNHKVCKKNDRTPGVKGNSGPSGSRGADGPDGSMQVNAIQFTPISPYDFQIETEKPAIISCTPTIAFVGDTITVHGMRFLPDDKVVAEAFDGQINVPCQTTVIASSPTNSTLQFVVPDVPGGYVAFQVEQADGTRSSSSGSVMVRPLIETIVPNGRIRPGMDYFIKGKGLGRYGNIWINGFDIGNFTSVDNNTIKFRAKRPPGIAPNEAGEVTTLKVVNAEGFGPTKPHHSAEFPVTLDTHRTLVFGDSVMWGGGLYEHEKFYKLSTDYAVWKLESIGSYITVKAHHGAPIGAANTTVKPEIPGEMSTLWPTISQQVDSLANISDAAHVDLIFVDGGANDLPITEFMLRSTPSQLASKSAELKVLTKTYCYDDMKVLLQKLASSFVNANIIVTGYYHIFSADSDMSNLLAIFAGLTDGEPLPLDPPSATKNKFATLSDLWVAESNVQLAAAVNDVNASLSTDPRIYFVDPKTNPSNAAHAPNSLLWEPDIASLGGPTDPIWQVSRMTDRETHKSRLQAEPSATGDRYSITKKNSSYHPNAAGALNYFNHIKPVIDGFKTSRRVALRAFNNRYVCAEGGGGGILVGDRPALGPWEAFHIVELGNNTIALRSETGAYVSAVNGGGGPVLVNATKLGPSETFVQAPVGSSQDLVSFATSSGKFLTVNQTSLAIQATATSAAATQAQFRII